MSDHGHNINVFGILWWAGLQVKGLRVQQTGSKCRAPRVATRLLRIPRYWFGWVKFTYPVLFAGCRVKPFPGGRYVGGGAALEVFGPNRGINLNRRRRRLALQASVVQRSDAVSSRIFGGSDVCVQTAQRSAFRVAATKLFSGNRAPRVYNRNERRQCFILGEVRFIRDFFHIEHPTCRKRVSPNFFLSNFAPFQQQWSQVSLDINCLTNMTFLIIFYI